MRFERVGGRASNKTAHKPSAEQIANKQLFGITVFIISAFFFVAIILEAFL